MEAFVRVIEAGSFSGAAKQLPSNMPRSGPNAAMQVSI